MTVFGFALVVEGTLLAAIATLVVARRAVRIRRDRLTCRLEERAARGLRAWLLEGHGARVYTEAFNDVPAHIALQRLAAAMTEHIPAEHRDELVVLLREAGWTRAIASQVGSRYWWRRLTAARLLAFTATIRERELVRRLMDDQHPAVRTAATRCLTRLNDPALVALLLDRLPTFPPFIRAALTVTLRDVAHITLPEILRRLERPATSDELETWVNVVEVLGSPEAYATLARLASHPEAAVRLAVARALKRQFHADASNVLVDLLRDEDWRVRAQAARSLGALAAHETTPLLAAALADPAWWVRFRASLALAQMGETGRRVLRESRRARDRMARDMASLVCGLSEGSIIELTEA